MAIYQENLSKVVDDNLLSTATCRLLGVVCILDTPPASFGHSGMMASHSFDDLLPSVTVSPGALPVLRDRTGDSEGSVPNGRCETVTISVTVKLGTKKDWQSSQDCQSSLPTSGPVTAPFPAPEIWVQPPKQKSVARFLRATDF
jgi:hypothetical protein